MARRTVLTILTITFSLALVLSIYFQLAERAASKGPSNRSQAPVVYFPAGDLAWDWPALPTMTPEAGATPAPTATPVNTSPVVRITAPSIGVDAPIVIGGLDAAGVMDAPPDPVSVVWYDFSAHPGSRGNVVLAGHVDYHNYGPAVFWKLRDLHVGDRVQVSLQDGSSYTYQVQSLVYYDADSAPIQDIVGGTQSETLTMITCGGEFNRKVAEYNKRLVVRATRL
jgi:LPXTG-site transpeptidase (sortase) family protein